MHVLGFKLKSVFLYLRGMIMNHNVGFFSAIYKEIPCQGEMTNDDPFAPSEVFQDFQRESE